MARNEAAINAARHRAGDRPPQPTGPARAEPQSSTPGGIKPPPRSSTPAQPPAAPAPQPAATPAPAPFLTPQQNAALTNWNTKYANAIAELGYADTAARTKYNETVAADTLKNSQSVDMTNQAMGARGMFRSSIRQNALNDLSATLAMQTNLAGTARDATLFHDQGQRNVLAGEDSATQGEYQGLSVENAQLADQALPPAPPTAPGGANGIVPTPPVRPPQPSGPPRAEPQSSTPGGITRAAQTRIGVPGPGGGGGIIRPRVPGLGPGGGGGVIRGTVGVRAR